MNESTYQPVSTFGHIYNKALSNHLKKIGNTLNMLRKARREDIHTVTAEVNIRPEILEKIEKGEHDFRINTFLTLCDYFNIDHQSLIGKGEGWLPSRTRLRWYLFRSK